MIQNPLTLDALRVVESIDRCGSFKAAAAELNRVTSALSYTVQKLEEDLGVTLFDRSGQRARLTPAGRLLVERGRELLAASHQLAEDARAVAQGWERQLTIAVDAVYPESRLLALVARFYALPMARQAGTAIRLSSEVLGGPWDALESGRADIAIAPQALAPGSAFRTRVIGTMPFVFVAAPAHPVFDDQAALESHRAIVVADTSRERAPRSARLGKRQPTLTVSSMESKIAALEAGLGVGSMPLPRIEAQLARGSLRQLDGRPEESLTLVMAWQAQPSGRAKQWFLRHLPDCF